MKFPVAALVRAWGKEWPYGFNKLETKEKLPRHPVTPVCCPRSYERGYAEALSSLVKQKIVNGF